MSKKHARSEELSSRSAAACNACRTRKQKCDGKKPSCTRCRQLDQDCDWPQQQKRGPAKGYTEALEARLAETEDVLLRVLPCVAMEDLFRALQEKPLNSNNSPSSLPQPSGSKSLLDRKQVVETWSRSPLRTLADIQRWYEERTAAFEVMDKASSLRESVEDTNFPIPASSSQRNINTAQDDQEPLTMTTFSGDGFEGSGTMDLDLMGNFENDGGGLTRYDTNTTATTATAVEAGTGTGSPRHLQQIQMHQNQHQPQQTSSVPPTEPPNSRNTDSHTLNPADSARTNNLGITLEFQEHFLW